MPKVPHGKERPEYLPEPLRSVKYASEPDKVRRGVSGDKLRRKAFEGKL